MRYEFLYYVDVHLVFCFMFFLFCFFFSLWIVQKLAPFRLYTGMIVEIEKKRKIFVICCPIPLKL
jgi:hypothetical protein